jgi:hypothetical protein
VKRAFAEGGARPATSMARLLRAPLDELRASRAFGTILTPLTPDYDRAHLDGRHWALVALRSCARLRRLLRESSFDRETIMPSPRSGTTRRSTAAYAYDDDRSRRRDVSCTAGGLFTGAGLGLILGVLAAPSVVLPVIIGALAGGIVGRLIALRISSDDWDPHASEQAYVGASSPDDDIASG